MPVRNFVYQNAETLITQIIPALERARQTGSIVELRAAGILTRTTSISQTDLVTLYYQARYEVYLKGKDTWCNGVITNKGDPKCKQLEPKDPYQEKIMRVETVYNLQYPYNPYFLP